MSESSRVFTPFLFDCLCAYSSISLEFHLYIISFPSSLSFFFSPFLCLAFFSSFSSLSRPNCGFEHRYGPMLLPRARRRMTSRTSAWRDGTQSNVHEVAEAIHESVDARSDADEGSTFLTLHHLFVVVVSGVVSFLLSLWLARCLVSLQLLTSLCLQLLLSYLSSLNDCFSVVSSHLSSVSSSACSLLVFAVVCLSTWWTGLHVWVVVAGGGGCVLCVEVSEFASSHTYRSTPQHPPPPPPTHKTTCAHPHTHQHMLVHTPHTSTCTPPPPSPHTHQHAHSPTHINMYSSTHPHLHINTQQLTHTSPSPGVGTVPPPGCPGSC